MRNTRDFADEHLSTSSREAPQAPYERMYRKLYDYRFGKIGFLELLCAWEEILQIPSPIQASQA